MKRLRHSKEHGFTIAELLITIVLIAIVAVGVTTLVLQLSQTAQKFTASVTTQNKAADAVTIIGREVASATKVVSADDWKIQLETVQDGQKWNVYIMYWNPSDATGLPSGMSTENLPDREAIIEYRVKNGETLGSATVLTEGYEKARQAKTLFTYFDKNNKVVPTPISEANALDSIKRVEYQFSLKVQNRNALLELASSAVPRSIADVKNSGSLAQNGDCIAPNLNGTIPSGERATSLNWNERSNASNGYTLYRSNTKDPTSDIAVATIGDRTVVNHVDNNNGTMLTYGEQYVYTIVANCGNTVSPRSNEVTVYVVPDSPEIQNINTKKALTDTLATATETGTRNTSTDSVGKKYTVARNLQNQVIWSAENGAVSYRVYRDGVYLATTPGTSYLDSATYGDQYTYSVAAVGQACPGIVNCGGEGAKSGSEQLISPPAASQFRSSTNGATPGSDPTRPDTSASATLTDNMLILTTRAANTTGFETSRVTTLASTASCDLTTRYSTLDFTTAPTAGVKDANVQWGSFTCYSFTPYNDAGKGIPSTAEIKQYPGKFSISKVASTQYQYIDTARAVPTGAQCWVSNVGTTGVQCNVNAPRSSTNKSAVGLFGTVDNKKTNINVTWSRSLNATSDYTVDRERTASGGTIDQSSVALLANKGAVYVNGPQSLLFMNEMPGSAYKFTVKAKSANGEVRAATPATTVTSPDIPRAMDNIYQTRSQSANPNAYIRATVVVDTTIARGQGSTVTIVAKTPTGTVTENHAANSGTKTVASTPYGKGDNNRYTYTTLNLSGKTVISATIGRAGYTYQDCSNPCSTSFGNLPEKYPTYYSGTHSRYYGGGAAANSIVQQGNNNAVDAPTVPTEPTGGVEEGEAYTCSTISEDTAGFIDEYGCEYGQGIPVKPSNVAMTKATGETYNVTWTAPSYPVTGYIVSTTVNGEATTTTTVAGTSATVTIPAAKGGTVVVSSYNATTRSPESAPVTVGIEIPSPTNPHIVDVSTNYAQIAWDEMIDATSYEIVFTAGSTTKTISTVESFEIVEMAGVDFMNTPFSFKVRALGPNGAMSAYSPVISSSSYNFFITPRNVAINSVDMATNTAQVSFEAVPTATSYRVRITPLTSTGTNGTSTSVVLSTNSGAVKPAIGTFQYGFTISVAAVRTVNGVVETTAYSSPLGSFQTPKNASVSSVTSNSFNFKVDPVAGASGYQLKVTPYTAPGVKGTTVVTFDFTTNSGTATLPAGSTSTFQYGFTYTISASKVVNGTTSRTGVGGPYTYLP